MPTKSLTAKKKKIKLPDDFRYLMWGYDFEKIDLLKHKERIIINTINYGQWKHWRWLVKIYGKQKLRNIIKNIPVSEFRNSRALTLICLILGIKKMLYANRSDKIRTKRNY